MSTIMGLMTPQKEGIIIASDSQWNFYDGEEHEGKRINQRYGQKCIFGDYWAIATVGVGGPELRRFYGQLRGDGRYRSSLEHADKMIKEALGNGYFKEVTELNRLLAKKGHRDRRLKRLSFCCEKA